MHWKEAITTRYSRFTALPAGLRAAARRWWQQLQLRLGDGWQRLHCIVREHLPEQISIASKLALTFTLLIASGMIVLGIMVGTNQTQLLQMQMDKYGHTLVQQMAESSREPLLANDHVGLEFITHNLTSDANILGAAIYSDEAKLVQQAGTTPSLAQLKSTGMADYDLKQQTFSWRDSDLDGTPRQLIAFITPIRFRDITVGYALLSFDHTVLAQAQQDTVVMVTTTILAMLLAAVLTSFYLGNRLTRPIYRLVEASRAYSQGDYSHRIEERRNDEIGVLMSSLNHMGEGLLRKEQVEQVFSRYVSPQVAQKAISDLDSVEQVSLGGRHVEASVLFADIVGFTSISESLAPQEVSELLNFYFSQLAQAVRFCHGHIDKYMGDCAMVVFGVPEEHEEHAFNALACGWMIQQLINELNRQRKRRNLQTVEFRIGVNTGTMLAGNMGSAERMDYTVVGDAVNLASRLSHAGKPREVILTEEMFIKCKLKERLSAEEYGTMQLRGKSLPVKTYRITEILDPFRRNMLAEIRRILDMTGSEAA